MDDEERAKRAEALIKRYYPAEMLSPRPETQYYAVTMLGTGNPNSPLRWSAYSHFAGYADEKPRREIRQASLVIPTKMLDLWRDIATPGVVVNTKKDFYFWMRFGGNAIIEKSLAEEVVPDIVGEKVVGTLSWGGFTSIDSLPKAAKQHAPTPVHRMKILQRDNYRCRICGRSSDDNVDIVLHIHHIRLWSNGGLTEDENLITLCHTCHSGLKPHFEPSLFSKINPKWPLPSPDWNPGRDYWRGVKAYQDSLREKLAELREGHKPKRSRITTSRVPKRTNSDKKARGKKGSAGGRARRGR